ncbi:DapH/DapD/GlmU-related protein [Desulfosporosinus youngiae]|uniref:Phosphonate metabolim protein, transferase hexapeptide repeat family n=1 Tax=Desulfosporosinus youngiae DSM 17734 TaxID=768710 RepID=H5Y4E3_9FIRM|nr:DapH/DapD/GlmU-related protein [Desulfosporosinus youngiae]EHQ89971.1 phosphonate metabolim protein, transferase hexapeptide repeat family [Desulfosporosinus youngiae DSM 17734]
MILRLGEAPTIHENCQLYNAELGRYTEIGLYNVFENVVLGDFSYTGRFCTLQNVEIGRFSNIADMVRIGPVFHPVERPTLHHFTYRRIKYGLAESDDELFYQWRREQKAYIGHDTWIGHGAIIMPGVRIGNGAVVGSGAVVTKDVDPYRVVVGVPAKPIKRRFAEDILSKLEAIKWWDWPYETIKARLDDFCLPINEFIDKHYRAGE